MSELENIRQALVGRNRGVLDKITTSQVRRLNENPKDEGLGIDLWTEEKGWSRPKTPMEQFLGIDIVNLE